MNQKLRDANDLRLYRLMEMREKINMSMCVTELFNVIAALADDAIQVALILRDLESRPEPDESPPPIAD